ncbi:hypothetical protein M422DRAFT_50064 [Sphaerobolus stellatus SS14]|uniref:Unplaced genomic scaffold SPHSTscaffold_86, whole genome shotgun sequence n=1 Tax=Sphaerobolus stellatus (strain SS14) TaxID=990650 RepID=A0A0C9U5S0_SPHS4|nr:hypothetical protein M422DRAFT_50064 [Sphaerobolus stellatus SS14]
MPGFTNRELQKRFSTATTEDFFNTIIPVDEDIVNLVLDNLKERGLYGKTNHQWQGISTTSIFEDGFYGPFITMANAINSIIRHQATDINHDKDDFLRGEWINGNHTLPKSERSVSCPDIAFIPEGTDPGSLEHYKDWIVGRGRAIENKESDVSQFIK